MRFSYDPYSIAIDMDEGEAYILQIENSVAYTNLLSDLYMIINTGEGDAALYDGEKEIDLKKYSELIFEPFSVDLNNRKIKTQLYQAITENIHENHYPQYLDLCNKVQSFIEEATEDIPYMISFRKQFDVAEVLKLADVMMDYPCDSIAEKLNVYIKLLSNACKVKIIFAVDICRFVSVDDLNEIIKTARYNKVNLVLINSSEIGNTLEVCATYILDNALCFWKAE